MAEEETSTTGSESSPTEKPPAESGTAARRESAEPAAPKTALERIDAAIFSAETGMMSLFLSAITVFVFMDVVYRRLVAPDSKVGSFLAWIGGVTDPAARQSLDANVAPWAGALLLLLVVWAGATSAQRFRKQPFFPFPMSSLVVAVIVSAALAAIGFMMVTLSSRDVYGVLYGASLLAFVVSQARDKAPGWQVRIGVALLVVTPLFALVAASYFPQEYVWAKELSMICVLWVGFFGASVCVPIGKHIRVDTFDKAIPEAWRGYVAAAGHLLTAGFAALMTYMGYRYVFHPRHGLFYLGSELELTGFPDWIQTIAVPVAFGMTAIRFVAAAVSSVRGGTYGAAAKAEGMQAAEDAAAAVRKQQRPVEAQNASLAPKRPPYFLYATIVAILLLPLLGSGGILVAAILAMMILGLPLFVVLGVVAILCFVLWGGVQDVTQIALIERIRGLADNQALLAIPFFVMSGAVMSHGHISKRLVSFSMALVGWLPGGLAVSAVLACMIFAAISGSSPATVVAIGGMMGPALIAQGFRPPFAHGLVTSAGSLGILIPPSIPMIVYALVNTSARIEVERLFACGYGPGLVIGAILMLMGMVVGAREKTPRQPFSAGTLWAEARDGFWALMFPVAISAGIYSGVFNAIESACFSVVYAVVVEVYVHRAMTLSDVPKVFEETGVMLGSFLVILVVAMTFGEFLDTHGIPAAAAQWVEDMQFEPWQFLVIVNLLLLVVGCLLDIMSAIFIFVPLLAPMAQAAGIDPLHFGIIFIVNLEIGYLTPPVGLNLFVATTLFNRPIGYMVRAVMPFVGVMLVGLAVITFTDSITVGFANLLMGAPAETAARSAAGTGDASDATEGADGAESGGCIPPADQPDDLNCDGTTTMEEMMEYADRLAGGGSASGTGSGSGCVPPADQPDDLNCDGTTTMEEMMEYADRLAESPLSTPEPAREGLPAPPAPSPEALPAP